MSLTNTTAINQVLKDTHQDLITKHIYFTNDATQETDALKVNTATLVGRTVRLVTSNAAVVGAGFRPAEKLTGNTSNAVAYVLNYQLPVGANGGIIDAVMEGTTPFEVAEHVAGEWLKTDVVLATITPPTYILNLESITWSIVGPGSVEIEWGDGASFKTAVILGGSGYIGKNALASIIKNDAVAPNGNVYVSTHAFANNSSYTLVLEFQKAAGFAQRPIH